MTFKKLCDFKGEAEAWDAIAKLIEPLADIATDSTIGEFLTGKAKATKIEIAQHIAKKHYAPATKILSILAEQDYDDFKKTVNPAMILTGIITILNDKEMIDLFRSQGSMMGESNSGSATGNITVHE